MSEMSQYQTVFRISSNNKNSTAQPRVTKRNRKQVSCAACRSRKTKCDRQLPCMQCFNRGDGLSCSYEAVGRTEREEGSRASEAQLRLRKLEDMVYTLVKDKLESEPHDEGKSLSDSHASQNTHQLPPQSEESSQGHSNINCSESNYLGATHWQAILENIRDIQSVLGSHAEDGEEMPASNFPNLPDILIDTTSSLTLTDIRNSLPPRPVADKLLSIYFNTRHHQVPIIHTGKFTRQYDSFWVDPALAPLLWISMLFSILHAGSEIYHATGNEPKFLDGPTSSEYLRTAGSALVTGKYHQARPYSVEAVFLYGLCKFWRREDTDMESWMIMGVAARLAMKMGYHRDPRHLKNISPFEGEMRRRVFFAVEGLDLVLSFQAGLPATIHEEDCDTGPPRNLLDTDFDEDFKALPESRQPIDPTPMLYCKCKLQQMQLLHRVSRHALSCKTPTYEETMKLDRELHDMHAKIPPIMRIGPLSSTVTENPSVMVNRLNIELAHLRCVFILHRTYLSYDKSNPNFDYSRRKCTEAALQTLNYEAELHSACQPGRRFYNDKWIISNLILYDFLLAAMILCLDLYESRNKPTAASLEELEIQIKKYDALKRSHMIWTSRKCRYRDAQRASSVLAFMLSKVPRPNIPPTLLDPPQMVQSGLHALAHGNNFMESSNSASYPATEYDSFVHELTMDSLDYSSVDPLNEIFSKSDPIDWNLVDQFLFDRTATGDDLTDWQLMDSIETQSRYDDATWNRRLVETDW